MRRILYVIGAVLAVAVVAIVWGTRSRSHRLAPVVETAEEAPLSTNRAHENGEMAAATVDRLRLAYLEKKVADLEAAKSPPPPAETRMPGPEERAKRMAEDYQYHEKLLAVNAGSPRDEQWAAKMEAKIATTFQAPNPSSKMKYEGADCRTNSCAVKLSWPNRQTALGDLKTVMNVLATSMCAREIALPPPGADDEGELHAAVVLQCSPPPGQPPS